VSAGVDLDNEPDVRTRAFVALVVIRRLGVVKFFAAFLVTLSITPFTAPFLAYDPAEVLTETAAQGSVDSSKKPVQESVDFAGLTADPLALSAGQPCHMAGPAARADVQVLRSLVLRI
jgi:hypothetical protein